MAREITEVWIYVPPLAPHNVCVKAEPFEGMPESLQQHIKKVRILTPHDAAVLEAAEAFERSHGKWHDYLKLKKDRGDKTSYRIVEAVRARRAANAGGEP